jgi:ketosteroid isomerase-like protein
MGRGRSTIMLAPLIMRSMMRRNQAATVESKDIEALKKMWADDVTLTFMGQPPIVGKPAVEAWYRSWFDVLEEVHESPKNFSLARPYALGFTNTVLWESTGEHVFKDGRKVVKQVAVAIDFERGKGKAIRIYVADPDGEKRYMGVTT